MGTQQNNFVLSPKHATPHALRGSASSAIRFCICFCALSMIGACATTKPVTKPKEETTAQKPPPVLFLRRKDRERLLEQQRLAKELAENSQATNTTADAQREALRRNASGNVSNTTIANLFDLPSSSQSSESTARPLPTGFGDQAIIGVGRDQATVAALIQYDLATAKQRVGSHAIYTLQVARYGLLDNTRPKPDELASFRQAAEEAVLQLRAAGDEAYFYHGPAGSTVTIGLFEDADYVTTTKGPDGNTTQLPRPYESARLIAARAKFPHNLVNGQTLEVRTKGSKEPIIQPSFVVGVP